MAPPISGSRPPTVPPRAPPSSPPPPAPQGGESAPGKLKTWVDSKNPLLPKDGYLQVEYKKAVPGPQLVPTRIKLADGSMANAKQVELADGTKGYLVKSGREQVLAVPMGPGSGGGFYFYTPQAGASSKITMDGRGWAPIAMGDTKLGHLFQLASERVNRGEPPVTSPADLAAAKKARDQAASAGVARKVDDLTKQAASSRGQLGEASKAMAKELQFLAPALADGTIAIRRNAKDEIIFEVADNPNMKPGEKAKLEEKFGDRLANLTGSARKVEAGLKRASAVREGTAAELVELVNSGPFIASLEKLPPAQRLAKVKEIAEKVSGTAAGKRLAGELFDFDRSRLDKSMGHLTPSTELGKMLFKDVYKDPAAKAQLIGLSLNLSGQLSGDRYGVTERMFEIAFGRELTSKEMSASFQITNAKPESLETGEGFSNWGDVSSMLAALGDGASHIADGAKSVQLETGEVAQGGGAAHYTGTALKAGAALVGTFQLMRGISEMASKPSVEGAVNIAEDSTRAVGAWASWLGKTDAVQHVGKVLGTTSDVIGLLKDLHGLATAKSPEKKYDKFVSSYASALIVAGGLAASVTPWGIAAQVVGLGVKLFREETSDTYDKAYGTLKTATKTQAERDAEAAAAAADYKRRSENWTGRMQ